MARYVALLRAVNVAGHARMAAADLVCVFAAAGARDVSSFGHAGNLMFAAPRGAAPIIARARADLLRRYGEKPVIVLRTADALAELTAAQPFAACGATPSDKLYVAFLEGEPRAAPVLPLASPAERLTILDRRGLDVLVLSGPKPSGFYGFPNAFVETTFGVAATTRNWSTVARLAKPLAS
jgi:uncharacterized protein (DUF1697 family)